MKSFNKMRYRTDTRFCVAVVGDANTTRTIFHYAVNGQEAAHHYNVLSARKGWKYRVLYLLRIKLKEAAK